MKIHELLCQIELIDGDIILEGNLLLLCLECAVCDDDEGVSTFVKTTGERTDHATHINAVSARNFCTVFDFNWMECFVMVSMSS